jgi:cobalamin transport system substrate-binding protein
MRTLAAFAAVLVLVSGARSYPIAQAGEPRRIISLVPALTEMVFAVGAGDRVVAVSSYDDYPPQVRSLPRVGALLDPDTERIIALRPDLVMVYGSQTDLMTQLTRASIPYFEYRHAGFAGITSTIRAIGQRIGRASAADSVAAGIERHFGEIRSRTANLPKPRTLLVFGRERGALRNIYASGGRGFLHDMLEAAGGTNVFADIVAESVQASSELILTRAPEVIIELRTAGMLEESDRRQEIKVWSALASLPAVRDQRIYLLTRKGLAVPGPGVADSTEEFVKILHPR